MIEIRQEPVADSLTGRGVAWKASATVDGETFNTASRSGATTALARVLVNADIADQPVEVYDQGRKTLRWPSLHAMAQWTYSEGDSVLHRIRWRPNPNAS